MLTVPLLDYWIVESIQVLEFPWNLSNWLDFSLLLVLDLLLLRFLFSLGFFIRVSLGFWDTFLFSVRLQSLHYLGFVNFCDALVSCIVLVKKKMKSLIVLSNLTCHRSGNVKDSHLKQWDTDN